MGAEHLKQWALFGRFLDFSQGFPKVFAWFSSDFLFWALLQGMLVNLFNYLFQASQANPKKKKSPTGTTGGWVCFSL